MGLVKEIGTIAELWRYPVKSMRGERLDEVFLEANGIRGDRRFAFTSSAAPAGKPLLSSAERTAMLRYAPRGGALPSLAGRGEFPLPLTSPELVADLSAAVAAPGAMLELVHSPDLPLTDVRPVSIISRATIRGLGEELGAAIDGQRFRSNLVLALYGNEPFEEDALSGRQISFGDREDRPVLQVLERIPRCRMVSLDPDTTAADPTILRHLAKVHGGRLGIYARVGRTGLLRVGDRVFLQDSRG